MKFLVDAQLPPALARALASEGHDAVHVCDLDMTSASDPEVWNEGIRRGAAIVTKDEDFILLGRAKGDLDRPTIVWIRIGNCAESRFSTACPRLLPALWRRPD
ncbi:DUF5615 family PIN-like protein [Nocardia amikacinitolerans]|uniref:DUF5615 family PIN-like protein n=1 Tax=Nocardia amikacinitolerans TaxID=756689 RepID=UPI00082DF93E|nr:DUF5615 family PIN-like protein [Nocardia amikacinitolerans]